MSKRKIFNISESLCGGLSETISIVENDTGIFRNTVIPMSRIEADPENPRKLAILPEELLKGPSRADPLYSKKQDEYIKLQELANTIKSKGLMQPIIVYKLDDKYRVVAGNRRFLASKIAGKAEIEARVFNKRPNKMELRLAQWIENTARDDLSLKERIDNIKSILQEYTKINGSAQVTSTLLAEITGLSLTQAKCYLSVIRTAEDLQEAIGSNKIQSLDKAYFLANLETKELRVKGIEACIKGITLKELKRLITAEQQSNKISLRNKPTSTGQGRKASKVNLGATKHPEIVKQLIYAILDKPEYKSFTQLFARVDWSELTQASKAFKSFIEILEKQYKG
jgi:ParB family chromosome partitioning protein